MAFSSIAKILIGPIAGIIEKSVSDKDLAAKIQHDILAQIIDSEGDYVREVSAIIQAEARSESWIARNWRPLTMLWFAFLLGMFWFGKAPQYLIDSPATVEDLFDLLKLGIGGYIVGRSVEKTVKTVANNGGVKKVLG